MQSESTKEKKIRHKRIHGEVNALFEGTVNSTSDSLQNEFDSLFQKLPSIYFNYDFLRIGHNHLIRLIKNYSFECGVKYYTPTGYLSYLSEVLKISEKDCLSINKVANFIKCVHQHDDFEGLLKCHKLTTGLFVFNLVLFSRIQNLKHLNAVSLHPDNCHLGPFGMFCEGEYESRYVNIPESKTIKDRFYHNPFSFGVISHIAENFKGIEFKSFEYANFFRAFASWFGFKNITLKEFVRFGQFSYKLLENIPVSEFVDHSLRLKHRMVPLSNDYFDFVGNNTQLPNKINFEPDICEHNEKARNDDDIYREIRKLQRNILSVLKAKLARYLVIQNLNELEPNIPFPIGRDLVIWYVRKLEIDKLRIKSVSDYHGRLFTRLCEQFRYDNPEDIPSEEFGLRLHNSKPESFKQKTKDDYVSTLSAFYSFLKMTKDVPELMDEHAFNKGGLVNVSAKYINKSLYLACIQAIQDMVLDEHSKTSLLLIAILGYRTGARLSELTGLTWHDVRPISDNFIITICSNSHRKLKNRHSTRTFYLKESLSEKELQLFKEFHLKLKVYRLPRNAPLFSLMPGSQNFMDSTSVSSFFSKLLTAIAGLPFSFHAFRHTALSNFHLLFDGHDEALCQIADYSQVHCDILRQLFFGVGPIDGKYWELSTLAGHRNPKTTVDTYLHFIRETSHLTMKSLDLKIPITYAKAVSGLSPQRINRTICENSSTGTFCSYRLLFDEFEHSLKGKIKPKKRSSVNQISNIDLVSSSKSLLTAHALILLVDDLHSPDKSLEQICQTYDEDAVQVEKFKSNLRLISQLKTQKGQCRFKVNSSTGHCLPGLNSKNDRDDLTILDDAFAKFASKEPDAAKEVLVYFLGNATSSSSDLPFRSKSELKAFVKPFKGIKLFKRFLLSVQLPSTSSQTRILKHWESTKLKVISHRKFVNVKNFKFGKGLLTLGAESGAANKSNNNYKKMSSSAFKLFFLVEAVKYLQPKDFEHLRNSN